MIEAKQVPRHRKMTVDEVMAFSFKVLPKQFLNGIWWLLSLFLVIILNIAAAVFIISIFDSNSTIPLLAMLDSGYMPDLDRYLVFALLMGLILLALDFIYSLFSTAYIFRLGIDAWHKQERTFGERLALAYKEGWALAGVTGLYAAAVTVITVISFVVTYTSVFTDAYWILAIQIVFNFASSVVMYYLSVKLSCWIPLIMEEYYGTFEAIRVSFAMTKGRGWRIFGYLILIGLILGFGVAFAGLMLGGIGVLLIAISESPFVVAPGIILILIAYLGAILIVSLGEINTTVGVYYGLLKEHTEDPVIPKEVPISQGQRIPDASQEPQQISNDITNKE